MIIASADDKERLGPRPMKLTVLVRPGGKGPALVALYLADALLFWAVAAARNSFALAGKARSPVVCSG